MLTVLSVAYPFAPIGPDAVGGAEQILSALERAVVAAGHRSLVVATAGSITAGKLLRAPAAPAELNEAARGKIQAAVRRIVARAARDADLVHLHGIDFHTYLPPPGPPALVTLHLPPAWYPPAALTPDRERTWFNCVSQLEENACPPGVKRVPPILNGVPVDSLGPAEPAQGDYVVTLGRICPEKGQHLALQAAHTAGVELLLGGEVFPYPEHEHYFGTCILPLLDDRRRFLGPLGLTRKRRLLAGARCLLVPSLAPETSSLVAMEALACGTPVIAFRAGALPEIIEHGRTGFLVEDAATMAEAIGAVARLDRSACRRTAEARFSVQRMASAYLALYQRLAAA